MPLRVPASNGSPPPAAEEPEDVQPADEPPRPSAARESRIELPPHAPAEAFDLGPPKRQFGARSGKTTAVGGGVTLGVGFFLPLLGFFIVFVMRASGTPRTRQTQDVETAVLAIGCIVGIVLVGVGIFYLVKGLFGSTRRVVVCDDGLVDCRGNNIEVCRWEDVDAFWRQVADIQMYVNGVFQGTRTTHKYRIQMKDDRRFAWDDYYRDVNELGDWIENEVSRRRLPEVMAELHAGRSVDFDVVVLTPYGLRYGRDEISWQEIALVEQSQGVVSVRLPHRVEAWAHIPSHKIANVSVFLHAVQALSGRARY
jgi:hypothetical protein